MMLRWGYGTYDRLRTCVCEHLICAIYSLCPLGAYSTVIVLDIVFLSVTGETERERMYQVLPPLRY